MATRGKFGRYPTTSTQPNLANTIVSLAREMQDQRDSNIMSAWEKGGTFEGKPVTDQMVLSHWRERMKHVSKDDPLYDQYSETVDQLTYSVAESKISTLYAQGKVSKGAMARFYLGWAKKIPVNSEFHRVLERNAAQFMKSVKAGGGGGGRGGGGSRGLSKEQVSQIHNEMPAQYIINVLTGVARDRGIIQEGQSLNSVRFGPIDNDPGAMMQIIADMNASPAYMKEVMGTLHKLNPKIPANGTLTMPMLHSILQNSRNNKDARAWAALGKGQVAKFNTLTKERDVIDEVSRQAGAWGPGDDYAKARQDFHRIWDNDTETGSSKVVEAGKYKMKLEELRDAAIKRGDERTARQLDSEARAAGGDDSNLIETVWESFTGFPAGNAPGGSAFGESGGEPTSDAWGTAADVQKYTAEAQAVADGTLVYTYGDYNSRGQFEAKAGGSGIGVIDKRYITQDPGQFRASLAPGANGVESVMVQGVPIMAIPQVPKAATATPGGKAATAAARGAGGAGVPGITPAGPATEPGEPYAVGRAYDTRSGSLLVRVYALPDGQGGEVYTTDPPWGTGVLENFEQKNLNGQPSVLISVPPGMNTPVAPWNDPVNARHTGVTPWEHYTTLYAATAMATPEGQAKLGTITAPEAMDFAQTNYPTKALAAYSEIAGLAANLMDRSKDTQGLMENRRGQMGTNPPVQMPTQYNTPVSGDLPSALTGWQQKTLEQNGFGATEATIDNNPKKHRIVLPDIPLVMAGQGRFDPLRTSTYNPPPPAVRRPIEVPAMPTLKPVPNSGFRGNPGKAADDLVLPTAPTVPLPYNPKQHFGGY